MGLWEGDGGYDWPRRWALFPRHRAVLEKGDMWLGHIIASYSLDFSESESLEDDEPIILGKLYYPLSILPRNPFRRADFCAHG